MPTIVVALQDIITDEANPIDLTLLPTRQTFAHFVGCYRFPSYADITDIKDSEAAIGNA